MLITLLSESGHKKPKAKIVVKHPDILEVPEGKKFWQLPLSHYVKLVEKHGYREIARALTNLEVWNKRQHPEIAEKARDILERLKKKVAKKNK